MTPESRSPQAEPGRTAAWSPSGSERVIKCWRLCWCHLSDEACDSPRPASPELEFIGWSRSFSAPPYAVVPRATPTDASPGWPRMRRGPAGRFPDRAWNAYRWSLRSCRSPVPVPPVSPGRELGAGGLVRRRRLELGCLEPAEEIHVVPDMEVLDLSDCPDVSAAPSRRPSGRRPTRSAIWLLRVLERRTRLLQKGGAFSVAWILVTVLDVPASRPACRLEIERAPSRASMSIEQSDDRRSSAAWTSGRGRRSEPKLFDIVCTSFTHVDMLGADSSSRTPRARRCRPSPRGVRRSRRSRSGGVATVVVSRRTPRARVRAPSRPRRASNGSSRRSPSVGLRARRTLGRLTLVEGTLAAERWPWAPGLDPPGVAPGRPVEDSGG